jgi:hypothetical protein
MRTTSLAALGTLALLVAASAFGQQRLTADIPFEFTLANKVMPAGHYDITSTATLVLVRSYASGAAAFSAANRTEEGSGGNAEGRLVFNKYGDKYFLDEVWAEPGTGSSASLLECRNERSIAHASREVARVTIPLAIPLTGAAPLASLQ